MSKFNFEIAGVTGGKLGIVADEAASQSDTAIMAVVSSIVSAIKRANGYRDASGKDTTGYVTYRASFLKTMAENLGLSVEATKDKPRVKAWFAAARLAFDSGHSVGKVAGFSSIDAMRTDKATKKRDAKAGGRPSKHVTEKVRDYLTKMLPDMNGQDRRAVLVWFGNECRIKMTLEAPASE